MRKSQRFTRVRACHAALNRAGVMTSDTGSDRDSCRPTGAMLPGRCRWAPLPMIAAACRAALEELNSADGVRRCAAWNRWCFRRPGCACGLARRRCAGRVLAVRDPAIARWNPVDRPDPDLRVAQARVEDRGDWTGSEHASFAVVTADDDALLVQVMRVGVLPRPGPQAHSDG